MYQWIPSQTHHCHNYHQVNIILPMTYNVANLLARMNLIRLITKNTANTKSKNAIKVKIVENTRNRNFQTHRRVIMILPKTVTIDARDIKIRKTSEKGTYQIMREVNRKAADNSI